MIESKSSVSVHLYGRCKPRYSIFLFFKARDSLMESTEWLIPGHCEIFLGQVILLYCLNSLLDLWLPRLLMVLLCILESWTRLCRRGRMRSNLFPVSSPTFVSVSYSIGQKADIIHSDLKWSIFPVQAQQTSLVLGGSLWREMVTE